MALCRGALASGLTQAEALFGGDLPPSALQLLALVAGAATLSECCSNRRLPPGRAG